MKYRSNGIGICNYLFESFNYLKWHRYMLDLCNREFPGCNINEDVALEKAKILYYPNYNLVQTPPPSLLFQIYSAIEKVKNPYQLVMTKYMVERHIVSEYAPVYQGTYTEKRKIWYIEKEIVKTVLLRTLLRIGLIKVAFTARPYYCVSNCTIGPYFNSFHDLSSLRKHVYGNSHLQNMTVRNYKAFLNELVELNNKCPDHKLIICLNAQCPFFTDARIVESKQHRC